MICRICYLFFRYQWIKSCLFFNICLKRANKLKKKGFVLDENLNWQSHITLILNEERLIFINLTLSGKYLTQLHFCYVHSRINYANDAWASTSQAKFKKHWPSWNMQFRSYLMLLKKIARWLFQVLSALNIYQANLLYVLTFMQRIKAWTFPRVFSTYFQPINYVYETRFFKCNSKQPDASQNI